MGSLASYPPSPQRVLASPGQNYERGEEVRMVPLCVARDTEGVPRRVERTCAKGRMVLLFESTTRWSRIRSSERRISEWTTSRNESSNLAELLYFYSYWLIYSIVSSGAARPSGRPGRCGVRYLGCILGGSE